MNRHLTFYQPKTSYAFLRAELGLLPDDVPKGLYVSDACYIVRWAGRTKMWVVDLHLINHDVDHYGIALRTRVPCLRTHIPALQLGVGYAHYHWARNAPDIAAEFHEQLTAAVAEFRAQMDAFAEIRAAGY